MFGSSGSGVAKPLSPPPTDPVPHAAGNAAPQEPAGEGPARAARRGAVLPVAEHVVGDRVVHGHVVHLGERELDLEPGLAPVLGDRDAAVVRHRHPVGVRVVNPHVVVVPAGGFGARVHPVGPPRVERRSERRGQEVGLVAVVRRCGAARVVGVPSGEVAVVGLDRPGLAAVAGGPELAALDLAGAPVHRVHAEVGDAVAGLDERVHPAGVRLAHAERPILPMSLMGNPLPSSSVQVSPPSRVM